MVNRAVFLEKSWVKGGGPFGLFHYAVKVDDDWYEVDGEDGGSSISGFSSNGGSKYIIIKLNGTDFKESPKRKRKTMITGELTLAGATYKTDDEIEDFNYQWIEKYPTYDMLFQNCQTYAFDLIQYLVGGSFKMTIPLSSVNAWADGPGSHEVYKDGYYQSRATTGKAGVQSAYVAAEAEGPSAGVDSSELYVGAEASLGRVEAQVLGVGARLEPNVNTGIGITDGQVKVKAAGFGLTVGKGFAIHTPLGSLGFGRF